MSTASFLIKIARSGWDDAASVLTHVGDDVLEDALKTDNPMKYLEDTFSSDPKKLAELKNSSALKELLKNAETLKSFDRLAQAGKKVPADEFKAFANQLGVAEDYEDLPNIKKALDDIADQRAAELAKSAERLKKAGSKTGNSAENFANAMEDVPAFARLSDADKAKFTQAFMEAAENAGRNGAKIFHLKKLLIGAGLTTIAASPALMMWAFLTADKNAGGKHSEEIINNTANSLAKSIKNLDSPEKILEELAKAEGIVLSIYDFFNPGINTAAINLEVNRLKNNLPNNLSEQEKTLEMQAEAIKAQFYLMATPGKAVKQVLLFEAKKMALDKAFGEENSNNFKPITERNQILARAFINDLIKNGHCDALGDNQITQKNIVPVLSHILKNNTAEQLINIGFDSRLLNGLFEEYPELKASAPQSLIDKAYGKSNNTQPKSLTDDFNARAEVDEKLDLAFNSAAEKLNIDLGFFKIGFGTAAKGIASLAKGIDTIANLCGQDWNLATQAKAGIIALTNMIPGVDIPTLENIRADIQNPKILDPNQDKVTAATATNGVKTPGPWMDAYVLPDNTQG